MIAPVLLWLLSAAPAGVATQSWKVSAGDWSGSTPHIAASGDTVLFDTYQDLRLVRISDGGLVRKIQRGNCLGTVIDLKIEDGLAVALCESPHGEGIKSRELHTTLVGIDLKTGKTRWSREGSIPAPIALVGALVVFSDGERVVAIDLTMGKPVWSGKASPTRFGVSTGGVLAVIATETSVVACSLNDGIVKWSGTLAGWPQAAPLVTGDWVFVVHDPSSGDEKRRKSEGNRLSALAAADGKLRWKHDFKGESLFFQPVVIGDVVLVVGMGEEVTDGHLWALKQATGELAWSVPWSSDANGHDFRPTPMADVMLTWRAVPKPLGAYELAAFDPASGVVKWSFAPTTDEKFTFSRPLPVGSRVIYADGDTVRAITVRAGK